MLNENGSPQNQVDGEVSQNELLFQQLRQMIQTYENLHNIQDISEVYKNLSLTNEGQVQIDNHDPEMIKKLKELINSEDRDQLIQEYPQEELVQFMQFVEQLQRSNGHGHQYDDGDQNGLNDILKQIVAAQQNQAGFETPPEKNVEEEKKESDEKQEFLNNIRAHLQGARENQIGW